jgi:hypothetical protein
MRRNIRQCTVVILVKTASFDRQRLTLGEFFFGMGVDGPKFSFFHKSECRLVNYHERT